MNNKLSLRNLMKYSKKNNPKLGKVWLDTMQEGGQMSNMSGGQYQAILGIIQQAVSGVQNAVQSGKNAASVESLNGIMKNDTNPFMRMGGRFKKFVGPTHEGGGIPIDSGMNTNTVSPDAEVEGNETGFQVGATQPYIYSDRLMDTNNKTFADNSKSIDKKYKREDDISKSTKSVEMNLLSKRNDVMRNLAQAGEQIMMRCGGKMKKYALGGRGWDDYENGGSLPTDNSLDYLGESPFLSDTSANQFFDSNYGFGNLTEDQKLTRALSGKTSAPNEIGIPPFEGLSQDEMFNKMMERTEPTYDEAEFTEEGPFQVTGLNESRASSPDTKQPNLNDIAMALKGSALVQSFMDSVQKPEQEKLQLNPNAAEVEQLMESLGVDYTSALNRILGERNAAIANARLAGNYGTQAVLANKAIAAAGRSASDLKMKEQQANVGIRAQEANIKAQLGSEERGERIRQQDVQSQNDAAQRMFVRDFYSNLSKIGTEFNKAQYVKEQIGNNKELAAMTITEGLAILGSKYPDFGITPDLIEKLKSGEASSDEYFKFLDAVVKVKKEE